MSNPSGISLDPWFDNYAERASGLTASEVRALFAVANRPEVVSLAGGMPFVAALPFDNVTKTVQRVLGNAGPQALQYGSGQGLPELREHIMNIMALEGIRAGVDDIVVTTGSQQGLDLISKLFINPGDAILAESPSYVGAMGVFRSYQARVEHVAMDDEGMIPQSLRERIANLRALKIPIKFLYLIPNFQNPAGVTLSAARRLEILDIAQAEGILVVEDNPYGLLWFDRAPPHAIRSADESGVIYLGSFSKTFAPGLRVGWVVAPHGIREKLVLASEAAILSPSSFSQMILAEYFESHDWKGQIDTFRGLYRERRDAMVAALAQYAPDIPHTTPTGGFYLWLTLPEGLDSKEMLPRAVKELVAYTPGTAFYANGDGRANLRLAFCYPEPSFIEEGIKRLSRVIAEELELLETFGPTNTSVSASLDAPPPEVT
ncbi:PLP-dependent aminotransferase family protein [Pontimonas sp.]|nr:PLP-dependent aminotransferase family protein [Pontimonas sp.]